MHCSEIIRQKSVMVLSNGSCVMTNDSELSQPSMNDAFMYVECSLPGIGVSITRFLSYGITNSLLFFDLFSSPPPTEKDFRSSNTELIFYKNKNYTLRKYERDILSMKLLRKFKLKKYNVLIKYHICIFVIYSGLLDIDYSKCITTFSQV